MNKIILTFIFLFASSALLASPCSKTYSSDESPGIVASRTCTLEWKDKEGTHAVELIYLRNGCKKMEGGISENCYIVRTCPAGENDDRFTSMPVMDKPEELNNFCTFSKPSMRVLLGADDEYPKPPASAVLECQNSKAYSIVLKSPKKTSKVCLLK
tara:strand:+ start:24943 stop:25410 length:468 start_codon:yes stop_codon:yes gene_type:complete